ncbi:helix-turn-helix domain-containing protein [Pseudonocardia spinosispora]|uniref:helix-turn-helix domain-containing protein n=1 Tax=Pseudonocardia spinosispora TaxID=103441 RepID=UPI0009FC466C|nr:helix-turn-helix transcriptional regulator [Pseudonocardia spinosispora]
MHSTSFDGALREIRTRRKLSQLELALRAHTSQRHVSFLEQGRSSPGREIVMRLGEALELSLRECNELLLAAGYAPAYPQTDLRDKELEPVVDALHDILRGHLPFPALVINRRGDLIAANAAIDIFTDQVPPRLLTPPANLYRFTLHPDGLAPRIRNLAAWRRRIIDRLHLESRSNPDPALDKLLAELHSYITSLNASPVPDDLGFAVPLLLDTTHGELQLITTIATFSHACDITLADLKLEAFLPASSTSATILTHLDSRRGTRNTVSYPSAT